MRTLSYLVAVCISTSALAGDLPHPKPTKAHEFLARDAGKWDCDVKMFFEGPDAPPAAFKGEETNTLVSGDLYLQTAFTCQMGERKFEGHSLLGYDPREEVCRRLGRQLSPGSQPHSRHVRRENKDPDRLQYAG